MRWNFNEYAILAKSFSFWLAFLQRDLTWGSNVSLSSKWIPISFLYLLLQMAVSPMLIWISCVESVRRCDFCGFAFRRSLVNRLKKVFETFSRSCNTLFKLDDWGVLSSAQFAISTSGKIWNKSQRNMLNNNRPSMDPCRTLKRISDHKLYDPFSFTLCFYLIKYECNSFREGVSTP